MQTPHRFRKHQVTTPEQMPKNEHYVVLLFDTFTYTEAGYDRGDPSTAGSLSTTAYFAFEDRATWEQMIREFTEERMRGGLSSSGPRIVFMVCKGAGQLSISIQITPKI